MSDFDALTDTAARSYAQRWLASLVQASRAYWIVQGLTVLAMVVSTFVLIEPFANGRGPGATLLALRASLDALLFFIVTHAGIRPLLRLRYVSRNPNGADWLSLAGWLAVLAAFSLGIGLLVDHFKPFGSSSVTAIHFQAGEERIGFALQGGPMHLIAAFNLWVTYAIWCALYLGWKAIQARRRLQAQLRAARMQQLTHQLSPHFLFNAFNTIRGLVFEDAQRAADLITQLSELFRFHLQHEARGRQTLQEDWQLAQRYLDIEAVRLEARLRVKSDIDPVCLGRQVPSLTLLCLVENAIKHGIAPNPEGGWLRVMARPGADGWTLEVENSLGRYRADSGTRTGLGNLRERLQLGFGEDAHLEIEENASAFRVRLQLPNR